MIPNKSCLDLPKKISLVFMWADHYGGYGGCQDVTLMFVKGEKENQVVTDGPG